MSKIVGVIYPIPLQFVGRIFAEQRNVFTKYLAHSTSTKLVKGNKILFYASRGQKEIVGEAVIREIEFLTPAALLERHGDKVFLNRDELMNYASRRSSRTTSKKMMILVLSKPKKYPKGIKYNKPISMVGEYLTRENYNSLLQEDKNEGKL
jgi:hypothetical protein